MAAKRRIDRVLNTSGRLCSQPAQIAANSLKEMENGHVLEVICNDKRTRHSVPDLCDKSHYKLLEVREEHGLFHFIIQK